MMQGAKLLLGVIVAIVLLTMSFFAVMGTFAHAQEKAKTGADPTDFITRYEPSYEHKDLDSGAKVDLFVLRTDLALRRDLSFRVDFPLAHFDPGSSLDRLGFDSETGFGDMITQLIYKPYSGDQLAAIIGLRIDWDTATEDEVGQGGTTFAPLGAVAWYPRRQWIIAPVFQWFLGNDLDNDPLPGDRDRNELSYRQLVLWQPMHKYVSWILLDPEFIVDFEDDDESLTVGLEYGKMITKTIAVFIKPSLGLGDSDTDWAIKIGFRHMFPGLFIFK
jgi:hypothetical protein